MFQVLIKRSPSPGTKTRPRWLRNTGVEHRAQKLSVYLAVHTSKVRRIFVGETEQSQRMTNGAFALRARTLVKLTPGISNTRQTGLMCFIFIISHIVLRLRPLIIYALTKNTVIIELLNLKLSFDQLLRQKSKNLSKCCFFF
jgi:hypothetical protein